MRRGNIRGKGFAHAGDLIALGSKSSINTEKSNVAKSNIPKLVKSKLLSSYETKSKDVNSYDFFDKVVRAKDNNNYELCHCLIFGAIKFLKKINYATLPSLTLGLNYPFKIEINSCLVISLFTLAKEYPSLFHQPEVTEAFCSLLQRETMIGNTNITSTITTNQQAKLRYHHFSQLSIIVCNILCISYIDEEDWPDLFIKVYLEDSINDRIWVDNLECKSFVDNILTAFDTKFPANMSEEYLLASTTSDHIPIFPRYMSSEKQIEDYCFEIINEFLATLTPLGPMKPQSMLTSTIPSTSSLSPEYITKNFLKTLTRLSCNEKIRNIALTRLEGWLQNPKLIIQAQDLLSTICYNISQLYSSVIANSSEEDITNLLSNEVTLFLKIRLQKAIKPTTMQHYLNSFELLFTNKETKYLNRVLRIIINNLINNELSSSKSSYNSNIFEYLFDIDFAGSIKILAEECFSILITLSGSKEDLTKPLKTLLKEILRTQLKLKPNINMLELVIKNFTIIEIFDTKQFTNNIFNAHNKERCLLQLIDIISYIYYLTFTPIIKDNLLQYYQRHIPNKVANVINTKNSPTHNSNEVDEGLNGINKELNSTQLIVLQEYKMGQSLFQSLMLEWLGKLFQEIWRYDLNREVGEDFFFDSIPIYKRLLTNILIKIFSLSEHEVLNNLKDIGLIQSSSSLSTFLTTCLPSQLLINVQSNAPTSSSINLINTQLAEKLIIYQFYTRQTPLNLSILMTFIEKINISTILVGGIKKEKVGIIPFLKTHTINIALNRVTLKIYCNLFYRILLPYYLPSSDVSNHKTPLIPATPIIQSKELFFWNSNISSDIIHSEFIRFKSLLLSLSSLYLNEIYNAIHHERNNLNKSLIAKKNYKSPRTSVDHEMKEEFLSDISSLKEDVKDNKIKNEVDIPYMVFWENYWISCIILLSIIANDPETYGTCTWNSNNNVDNKDINNLIRYCIKGKISYLTKIQYNSHSVGLSILKQNDRLANITFTLDLFTKLKNEINWAYLDVTQNNKTSGYTTTTTTTTANTTTSNVTNNNNNTNINKRKRDSLNSSGSIGNTQQQHKNNIAMQPCNSKIELIGNTVKKEIEEQIIYLDKLIKRLNDAIIQNDSIHPKKMDNNIFLILCQNTNISTTFTNHDNVMKRYELKIGDNWDTLCHQQIKLIDDELENENYCLSDDLIPLSNELESNQKYNHVNWILKRMTKYLNYGNKLCSCRSPDFLIDMIKEEEEYDIITSNGIIKNGVKLDWINYLIESNDYTLLKVLPIKCLSQYILNHVKGFEFEFKVQQPTNQNENNFNNYLIPQISDNKTEMNELLNLCREILIERMILASNSEHDFKSFSLITYNRLHKIFSHFNGLIKTMLPKDFKSSSEICEFFGERLMNQFSLQCRTQSYKVIMLITCYDTFINQICLNFGSDQTFLSILFHKQQNCVHDDGDDDLTSNPLLINFMKEVNDKVYLKAVKECWKDLFYKAELIVIINKLNHNMELCNPFKHLIIAIGASLTYFETDFYRLTTYLEFFISFLTIQTNFSRDLALINSGCENRFEESDIKLYENDFELVRLTTTLSILCDFINTRYELVKLCLYQSIIHSKSNNPFSSSSSSSYYNKFPKLLVNLFVLFIQQILRFEIESSKPDVVIEALKLVKNEYKDIICKRICNELFINLERLAPWSFNDKAIVVCQKHFLPSKHSITLPSYVITANILLILSIHNYKLKIENFEELEHLTQFWFPSQQNSSMGMDINNTNDIINLFLIIKEPSLPSTTTTTSLSIITFIPSNLIISNILLCLTTNKEDYDDSSRYKEPNSILWSYINYITTTIKGGCNISDDSITLIIKLIKTLLGQQLPFSSIKCIVIVFDTIFKSCRNWKDLYNILNKEICQKYLILPNIKISIYEYIYNILSSNQLPSSQSMIGKSNFYILIQNIYNSYLRDDDDDETHQTIINQQIIKPNIMEIESSCQITNLMDQLNVICNNYRQFMFFIESSSSLNDSLKVLQKSKFDEIIYEVIKQLKIIVENNHLTQLCRAMKSDCFMVIQKFQFFIQLAWDSLTKFYRDKKCSTKFTIQINLKILIEISLRFIPFLNLLVPLKNTLNIFSIRQRICIFFKSIEEVKLSTYLTSKYKELIDLSSLLNIIIHEAALLTVDSFTDESIEVITNDEDDKVQDIENDLILRYDGLMIERNKLNNLSSLQKWINKNNKFTIEIYKSTIRILDGKQNIFEEANGLLMKRGDVSPQLFLYLDWCFRVNYYYDYYPHPSHNNNQNDNITFESPFKSNQFFHLFINLFFRDNSNNTKGVKRDCGINFNCYRFALTYLLHDFEWKTIDIIINKLLTHSDSTIILNPKVVLDFLEACLELPRIWQGCDSRSKNKYPSHLFLLTDACQFFSLLNYVLKEAFNLYKSDGFKDNIEIIISARIDALICPLFKRFNDWKRLLVDWFDQDLINLNQCPISHINYSFPTLIFYVKCALIYQIYLRFPDISYLYKTSSSFIHDETTEGYFDKYLKLFPYMKFQLFDKIMPSQQQQQQQSKTLISSDYSSGENEIVTLPINSTRYNNIVRSSRFEGDKLIIKSLKEGLLGNFILLSKEGNDPTFIGPDGQPLIISNSDIIAIDWSRIEADRSRDFLISLSRTHPMLMLRHLNLLTILLTGRTHLLYSIFAHKGHFALFKTCIHITFTLQPFIFMNYNSEDDAEENSPIDNLLDKFFDMAHSYAQFRFKMAFYIKKIITIARNYVRVNYIKGMRYLNTKRDILIALKCQYSDLFDNAFWISQLSHTTKHQQFIHYKQHVVEDNEIHEISDILNITSCYLSYINIPIKSQTILDKRCKLLSQLYIFTKILFECDEQQHSCLISNYPQQLGLDDFYNYLIEFQSFSNTYPDVIEPFMTYIPTFVKSSLLNKSSLIGNKYITILLNIMIRGWKQMSSKSLNKFYYFYISILISGIPLGHDINIYSLQQQQPQQLIHNQIKYYLCHPDGNLLDRTFEVLTDVCHVFPDRWDVILVLAFKVAMYHSSSERINLLLRAIKSQRGS